MKIKKSIGILTNASKTFKMITKNRVFQFQYDQSSEEFKNKRNSFLDFFGGNFQEINTLINELSLQGNVSVLLYLDKNLFISENFKISPYEITHSETIKESCDFDKWINGKDVIIISLNREKLEEFIDFYYTRIQKTKLCVICTGKLMANKLGKRFQVKTIFIQRKGVARFGADNRKEILALLS